MDNNAETIFLTVVAAIFISIGCFIGGSSADHAWENLLIEEGHGTLTVEDGLRKFTLIKMEDADENN